MMKDAGKVFNVLHELETNPWNTELQSLRSLEPELVAPKKLLQGFDTFVAEEEKQKKIIPSR